MKAEFPPLFAPGFHDIEVGKLEELFVKPFPNSKTRQNIYSAFDSWLNEIKVLGLSGEIWINGSFTTEMPDPSDIDCVLFTNSKEVRDLSITQKSKLRDLMNERLTAQQRKECICDVYIEYSDDGLIERSLEYWKKLYGFSIKNIAKGIVRLHI